VVSFFVDIGLIDQYIVAAGKNLIQKNIIKNVGFQKKYYMAVL